MKVYHVPGFRDGVELKDKEGVVDSNVTEYKGVTLSPNYPWKIRFDYELKDKPKKYFVHLVGQPFLRCNGCAAAVVAVNVGQ